LSHHPRDRCIIYQQPEKKMNQYQRSSRPKVWLMRLLTGAFLAACGGGTDAGTTSLAATIASAEACAPTIVSFSPNDGATNMSTSTNASDNVVTGTVIKATFDQAMDPSSLNSSPAGSTLTLIDGVGNDVPGTVVLDATETVASFTPDAAALLPSTTYTATISTGATSAAGKAMDAEAV
jgi:hypothetical protein